jgi:hypothetical protein
VPESQMSNVVDCGGAIKAREVRWDEIPIAEIE